MNYYKHLDKSKIQFDFVCDEDSSNIPYEEIKKLGGNVILCPSYTKVFKYQKFLVNLFKEKKYRIVHSNINALSVFPLKAAKKAGIPIRIAHSHSTSNKKEWKKTFIKNLLRPFSKKYANVYFACSELAGRWLFGNKTFDSGNITIINNAIDLEKFKFNADIRKKIRSDLNISEDAFVVGHIGRFVAQKNHTFLIDIFNEIHKKNENSVLLLIGQGPLQNEIKEKVDKLGLTNSVKFIGQVENANEYYNAMDVFVLPSIYEGLPVVGVEAQANGLLCELSSDMTKETKVLDTTRFIGLNESTEEWASEILNDYKDFKRVDSEKEMTKKHFNIKTEAKKLEDEYINFNKIRVCHVVSGLCGGGVESMIYNYCSRMSNYKIKFYLLYQHKPSKKNIEEFYKIGFNLKRIPSKIKHPLKNYKETYNYLKENKIDIVHCHMTLMNFIPLFAARKLKIKVRICHSHNSDVRKKNFIKKTIENLLKYLCVKNSTILVACGNDAGKYLYGSHKFLVMPNAIDLDKFKFDKKKRLKIREKYNMNDNNILIGHIGRFTNQKNHEFLIDVFNQLLKNNYHYRLLLLGSGENKETITKKINALNLNKYIIMPGIVSNPEDYYNAMDLFVLPSLWEGLPVVGVEAQINGLKCFFSNNIDSNVIITDNIKLIKLEKNIWIKSISKTKIPYNRNILKSKFIEKGLDIETEYKKLEKIYLKDGGD